MIEYKGYIGIFEFDEEKNLFYGKVSHIEDLVTFQGKSVKEVKEAFEDAVSEYITWCKKYRTPPSKPRSLLKEKDTRGGGN
jgi:predicted HicB family RNase H-like nuclease